MKAFQNTIVSVVAFCLAANAYTPPPCPTVTTTADLCPTFILKACLALSTISSRCDCPTEVPTATVAFPCDGPAPTGCGGTSYITDSATPVCGEQPLIIQTKPVMRPPVRRPAERRAF